MAEIRAVVSRGRDRIRVDGGSAGEEVPYFDEMIQEYVDKRRVKDGMAVLVATVSEDSGELERVVVNRQCATGFARAMANDGTLELRDDP